MKTSIFAISLLLTVSSFAQEKLKCPQGTILVEDATTKKSSCEKEEEKLSTTSVQVGHGGTVTQSEDVGSAGVVGEARVLVFPKSSFSDLEFFSLKGSVGVNNQNQILANGELQTLVGGPSMDGSFAVGLGVNQNPLTTTAYSSLGGGSASQFSAFSLGLLFEGISKDPEDVSENGYGVGLLAQLATNPNEGFGIDASLLYALIELEDEEGNTVTTASGAHVRAELAATIKLGNLFIKPEAIWEYMGYTKEVDSEGNELAVSGSAGTVNLTTGVAFD